MANLGRPRFPERKETIGCGNACDKNYCQGKGAKTRAWWTKGGPVSHSFPGFHVFHWSIRNVLLAWKLHDRRKISRIRAFRRIFMEFKWVAKWFHTITGRSIQRTKCRNECRASGNRAPHFGPMPIMSTSRAWQEFVIDRNSPWGLRIFEDSTWTSLGESTRYSGCSPGCNRLTALTITSRI